MRCARNPTQAGDLLHLETNRFDVSSVNGVQQCETSNQIQALSQNSIPLQTKLTKVIAEQQVDYYNFISNFIFLFLYTLMLLVYYILVNGSCVKLLHHPSRIQDA